MALRIVAILLVLAGCSAVTQREPACHGVTRSQLSEQYLAEVAKLKLSGVCNVYPDPVDCPEFKALQDKQDQRAKEWGECK